MTALPWRLCPAMRVLEHQRRLPRHDTSRSYPLLRIGVVRRLRVGKGRSCGRSRGSLCSSGSVRVSGVAIAVVVAVAVEWVAVQLGDRGSRASRKVGLAEEGRRSVLDWTGGVDGEDLQGRRFYSFGWVVGLVCCGVVLDGRGLGWRVATVICRSRVRCVERA